MLSTQNCRKTSNTTSTVTTQLHKTDFRIGSGSNLSVVKKEHQVGTKTRSSANAKRTQDSDSAAVAAILKENPKYLAVSQAHFSSGCGFMVGLGKPQLRVKFEVDPAVAEILWGNPKFWGAKVTTDSTMAVNLMCKA